MNHHCAIPIYEPPHPTPSEVQEGFSTEGSRFMSFQCIEGLQMGLVTGSRRCALKRPKCCSSSFSRHFFPILPCIPYHPKDLRYSADSSHSSPPVNLFDLLRAHGKDRPMIHVELDQVIKANPVHVLASWIKRFSRSAGPGKEVEDVQVSRNRLI